MSTNQPSPEPPNPPGPHHVHHHKLLIPTVAAAAGAGAAFLAIALSCLLAVLLYRRFRCNRTAPSSPSHPNPVSGSGPNPNPLRRFTYSQLRRATSSFDPALKLGQGGFGPVYRGALHSSGQEEIAVKVMDSGSLQGEREFQNELALAAKIVSAGSPADRARAVVPLGFCVDEARSKLWRFWRRSCSGEGDEEELVAGGIGLGNRVLLVYELMHNGSLQDALLGRKCPELLDWGRRFSIAVDIAKGLQFLHEACDPPVIHGDIKPSNILLDSRFAAKIADFGLARVKTGGDGEDAPAAAGQLEEEEEEEEEEVVIVHIDPKSPKERMKEPVEDDGSVMGETLAESTTTAGFEEAGDGIVMAEDKSPDDFVGGFARTPEGDEMALSSSPAALALEVASTSEIGGYDRMSVDSGKDTGTSGGRRGFWKKGSSVRRDWWRRQDNHVGGNGDSRSGVKDFVMEWIRSEIKKERPKSDWMTAPATSSEDCLPRALGRSDRRKHQRRLEWWASLDEERRKKEQKSRQAREWWREEYCEELTKKQQRKRVMKSKRSIEGAEQMQWWQEDEDCALPEERKRNKKSRSRNSHSKMEWWMDGHSSEMKRKMTGRRDWASGTEIPRSGGTISSTPSMRGTVCYVAPEYGGGGPLSEKCDIYSFGVLLLVLIAGRRPLRVMASSMSEFERANLISWARHLAHLGRLLELVDSNVKAVDKEQALLCITVALLCIQRSPALRPSIKEIVGMLTGQCEPPHLPLEFSPSPPSGFSLKSRKKARRYHLQLLETFSSMQRVREAINRLCCCSQQPEAIHHGPCLLLDCLPAKTSEEEEKHGKGLGDRRLSISVSNP